MGIITDCSNLDAILFTFGENTTVSNRNPSIFDDRFGALLTTAEVKSIFNSDDPTKGIRPDSELLLAIRKIVVELIIEPEVPATKDKNHINVIIGQISFQDRDEWEIDPHENHRLGTSNRGCHQKQAKRPCQR